ncbi:hypothetical protein ANTPLA_LOCUS1566 [Anthophora plagiata]
MRSCMYVYLHTVATIGANRPDNRACSLAKLLVGNCREVIELIHRRNGNGIRCFTRKKKERETAHTSGVSDFKVKTHITNSQHLLLQ